MYVYVRSVCIYVMYVMCVYVCMLCMYICYACYVCMRLCYVCYVYSIHIYIYIYINGEYEIAKHSSYTLHTSTYISSSGLSPGRFILIFALSTMEATRASENPAVHGLQIKA